MLGIACPDVMLRRIIVDLTDAACQSLPAG
jgi:hypothetical protein